MLDAIGAVRPDPPRMNFTILRRLAEAWWRDRGQFSRVKVPLSTICRKNGIR